MNKECASHGEYPYRGGASGYQMIEERQVRQNKFDLFLFNESFDL